MAAPMLEASSLNQETSARPMILRIASDWLSSPGRSPSLGPPRNRMWGFPPSGSSADVSCGCLLIVYSRCLRLCAHSVEAWPQGGPQTSPSGDVPADYG